MNDQKNIIFAVVMVFAVLFGFHYFYERPKIEALQQEKALALSQSSAASTLPASVNAVGIKQNVLSREDAVQQGERVRINTPSLHGSISLKGGGLDDLTLAHYHEQPDPKSPEIKLLSPLHTPQPYFVEFGLRSSDINVAVPTIETIWKVKSGLHLGVSSPVTLEWNNQQGLIFERTFTIDPDYLFTVTQKVINTTDKTFRFTPYNAIHRVGTPEVAGFFILHEGAIGVANGKLLESDYKELAKKKMIENSSVGGWSGFTDKYWLTALAPFPDQAVTIHYRDVTENEKDHYLVEIIHAAYDLLPHQNFELGTRLFAGAKQVHLLDRYEKEQNIARFDLAVDFGWFYFLTKPIFYILSKLHEIIGNFGISILILTVFIKLLLFPLANKSYRSMAKMKLLQPELIRLRERFPDDRIKMNEAMMALYKKYQVNPLAGCLPILVQVPVFFALYKVLFVTIEMRHAPFYGWIKDLSAPDPTSIFNLFGLIPWDLPSFLQIGAWPLIMGLTMFLQQRLNPQPTDPAQAKIFMFMPILFTILLAQFSAGLVIYWAWNNILSCAQQWLIMRMEGAKPLKSVKR